MTLLSGTSSNSCSILEDHKLAPNAICLEKGLKIVFKGSSACRSMMKKTDMSEAACLVMEMMNWMMPGTDSLPSDRNMTLQLSFDAMRVEKVSKPIACMLGGGKAPRLSEVHCDRDSVCVKTDT